MSQAKFKYTGFFGFFGFFAELFFCKSAVRCRRFPVIEYGNGLFDTHTGFFRLSGHECRQCACDCEKQYFALYSCQNFAFIRYSCPDIRFFIRSKSSCDLKGMTIVPRPLLPMRTSILEPKNCPSLRAASAIPPGSCGFAAGVFFSEQRRPS